MMRFVRSLLSPQMAVAASIAVPVLLFCFYYGVRLRAMTVIGLAERFSPSMRGDHQMKVSDCRRFYLSIC